MRRLLLLFFVFLVAGVGLALLFREHNGYVLIAYADWRLETSLFFFLGALIAFFWALVVLWRLAVAGVLLPSNLRGLFADRRQRKARRSLHRGLLRLYEGRWSEAEHELVRLAERHDNPAINYLAAARAAQHQNALDRRDRYLERATARRHGASELAVLLTQAELQLAQSQDAEALATLTRLREIEPEHAYVLRLLAELCERLGDWPQLRDILPALRKAQVFGQARWRELAAAAWHDVLRKAETRVDALVAAWRQVPRNVRREPSLQHVYATRLCEAGGHEEAAELIRGALKNRWDPDLVLLYGELQIDDRTAQLAVVEGWLKQYGEEPELLLVAGRLCLRSRLWGRARSYFENSLRGASRPQALLELGRLFEEIDQDEEARQAYRQGLEHVTGGVNS